MRSKQKWGFGTRTAQYGFWTYGASPCAEHILNAGRTQKLTLNFLHDFANDIMKPVARNTQVHIDYLSSQVVTEFMRDYDFSDGALDRVAYGSTVHQRAGT